MHSVEFRGPPSHKPSMAWLLLCSCCSPPCHTRALCCQTAVRPCAPACNPACLGTMDFAQPNPNSPHRSPTTLPALPAGRDGAAGAGHPGLWRGKPGHAAGRRRRSRWGAAQPGTHRPGSPFHLLRSRAPPCSAAHIARHRGPCAPGWRASAQARPRPRSQPRTHTLPSLALQAGESGLRGTGLTPCGAPGAPGRARSLSSTRWRWPLRTLRALWRATAAAAAAGGRVARAAPGPAPRLLPLRQRRATRCSTAASPGSTPLRPRAAAAVRVRCCRPPRALLPTRAWRLSLPPQSWLLCTCPGERGDSRPRRHHAPTAFLPPLTCNYHLTCPALRCAALQVVAP